MIRFTPLASSSAGNAYHVTDGSTALLLECGLSVPRLQETLWKRGLSLAGVSAALVTHEHGDHSKGARALALSGVPVYTSLGTAEAIMRRDGAMRYRSLKADTQARIGTWTALPFTVVHDAAEPLGFFLGSGNERLVFLTDTAYSPVRFAGVTHLVVECNYSAAALDRAVDAGSTHPAQRRRLLGSHFSLEQLLKLLESNDLKALREIHLIHLSDHNSDEQEMLAAVRRKTGRPVYVCAK